MVMVDSILDVKGKTIITSFLIKDDNVFLADGILREPALIENIAQSAAAGISALTTGEGEKPRLGFIGAIKELKIYKLPKAGDVIVTNITVTHEILNATVVEGKIHLFDQLIAECELRIFLENT